VLPAVPPLTSLVLVVCAMVVLSCVQWYATLAYGSLQFQGWDMMQNSISIVSDGSVRWCYDSKGGAGLESSLRGEWRTLN